MFSERMTFWNMFTYKEMLEEHAVATGRRGCSSRLRAPSMKAKKMTLQMTTTKTRMKMLRKVRSAGEDVEEEEGEVFKGGARLVLRGGGGTWVETGSTRSFSRRGTQRSLRRGRGGGWPRS